MKLESIVSLVRAGCTPAVKTFLTTYFRENSLSEEELSSLLDGLEKGDDVSEKILQIYSSATFFELSIQLRLVELFERKVKGAEKILMKNANHRFLFVETRMKLLDLFKRRVKGAHKLLKTLIQRESLLGYGYLFCENEELELIQCFEKRISGSKTLLKECIEKSQLHDAAQMALVEFFKKGGKGARELLELYISKYAPRFQIAEGIPAELVWCFKNKIDGAKEILLMCTQAFGLPHPCQKVVVDCMKQGIDGAKEILSSIIQDSHRDLRRYSQEAELALLDCIQEGVVGAQEVLEKEFPVSSHELYEESENKLIRLFTNGVAGAKDLLLKYTAKNKLHGSSEKLLLGWIEKGDNERKAAVLQLIENGHYWHKLSDECEKALVTFFRNGVEGTQKVLEAYMKRFGLSQEAETELILASNDGISEAQRMLLAYIRERAHSFKGDHRENILNALDEDTAAKVKEIFGSVGYFYYEL